MTRNVHLWLPGWIQRELRRPRHQHGPRHLYFCVADHYEPYWGGAGDETARSIVREWTTRYPEIAAGHHDSDGQAPQHTYFYPEEEYDPEVLELLAGMARHGLGDVEVHLHHDRDTATGLADKLCSFTELLDREHGLLRRDPQTGQLRYAFIHGNWALDNSHPEGRWCGVDNELQVLYDTGCRVDMTMPSAPHGTQTRTVNSIYFARGQAGACKSHDTGRPAIVGAAQGADELLMIQGPLTLDWERRKAGLLPRIENGEISADNPPRPGRVRRWVDCGISVAGAEDHVFIKVHTHGAQPRAMQTLLHGGLELLWDTLERDFRDADDWQLHYTTAWQMYEAVGRLIRADERTHEEAA
jgi:hypothetical protein